MTGRDRDIRVRRYGMVIDLDRCTGCGDCMVACYSENNVPFNADETGRDESINWIRVFKIENGKPFPDTEICYLPMPCMQCDGRQRTGDAPCISVCPVMATDYDPGTGIVSQIYTRCLGCRSCMVACPYHARGFNWWTPVWPADMEKYLNPNVSVRTRGVVEKCTFCFHRYQMAKEKAFLKGRRDISENEYQTACAAACPTGAITFGDLNDSGHAVHQLKSHTNAFRLMESLQTNPKVYYLSARKWIRRAGGRIKI